MTDESENIPQTTCQWSVGQRIDMFLTINNITYILNTPGSTEATQLFDIAKALENIATEIVNQQNKVESDKQEVPKE